MLWLYMMTDSCLYLVPKYDSWGRKPRKDWKIDRRESSVSPPAVTRTTWTPNQKIGGELCRSWLKYWMILQNWDYLVKAKFLKYLTITDGSRNGAFGISNTLRAWRPAIVLRFLSGQEILLQNFQTGSRNHATSYSKAKGDSPRE
jgi:hypothetical protein